MPPMIQLHMMMGSWCSIVRNHVPAPDMAANPHTGTFKTQSTIRSGSVGHLKDYEPYIAARMIDKCCKEGQ